MVATGNQVTTPAGARRAYGGLDREEVIVALRDLAKRVGLQRVTMRELASELGAAVPSVYYHVPNKQTALELVAESVLAEIPLPDAGPWDTRLIELYCAAREMILGVPGVAGILQTGTGNEPARRLDRHSRGLLAEAGLAKAAAAAAHTVLYTYLLGSITLEEARSAGATSRGRRQTTTHFRAGLDVIVAGIKSSAREE
ncbi:TetR/AcrR family transcriptional regulator C-terminal domain-containing protein [Mycobacterium sp. Aquia_216]|uniref:TetR/AcrR family transcriptional regulator C-terminal domain-containing protein n=1 Tax=Mycobacterium sp. Aquia_216 TaxID=2991729 RepID=UPI00227C252A|nr:TetR/AcrR family transcriptional regulator C-terminal domain-containing protein [Mycobacterium sp. Aquia_216]WAJ43212.1 TetR/AcrR family transcriptional regulator C-terminal domain-containing protein [Mycobacterium sp. Aquia_216]